MDTLTHEAGEWFRFERDRGECCLNCGGSYGTEVMYADIGPQCKWCASSDGYAPGGVELRRPFAALHGPGDDPYVVHDRATDEQVRTSFQGLRNAEVPAS
jgi:hypothetical protein